MNRPVVGFVWAQFGAYHIDRLEAVAAAFAGTVDIVGIEVATASDTYDWHESGAARGYRKVTLFPGANAERLSGLRVFQALSGAVRRERIGHLFVSGYEQPSHMAVAVAMRLRGRTPVVMLDSKFDDKPRRAVAELAKSLMMLPYRGGFAAGVRAAAYLRFLGVRGMITTGYDSVGLNRLRALAVDAPLIAADARAFVMVARLVPKKNHVMALDAFTRYRADGGLRRLRVCGGGPLMDMLIARARALGIADAVDFLGSQPQPVVAAELAAAFCLLVPSIEEQWGLVVNEALAFAVPVLCSDNVGARDTLVRPFVSGFVLAEDPSDWAVAMRRLDQEPGLHAVCSAGAARLAPLGDTGAFVDGVAPHLPAALQPPR